MRKKIGRLSVFLFLLLLVTALSGCFFTSSVDELYALPQMPQQYADLENKIKALLAEGAEYAAPASGSNLQSVQMVDLNADGQEEALIFMRNSAEERPLRIYIFRMEGDGYRECADIRGTGSSIYSVNYQDLTGDGAPELLIGWRTGAEAQMLTVYQLNDFVPDALLNATYARYHITAEGGLVLFHTDMDGACLADYYTMDAGGSMAIRSSLRLSCTAAELAAGRVISGTTSEGTNALFVTGISSDFSNMSVDLITRKGDVLQNVSVDPMTGYTAIHCAYIGLFPRDIDGDGSTEIPFAADTADSAGGQIRWMCYDDRGKETAAAETYHVLPDGWYLTLPEAIQTDLRVQYGEGSSSESVLRFLLVKGESEEEFLRIYTFSGANRELYAHREGRFLLRTTPQLIYAAEFVGLTALRKGISEDTIRESFHLIETEWLTGEN